LSHRVQELRAVLQQLSVGFDDKPPRGETYPVQQFSDALVGLLGSIDEAVSAADAAVSALGPPPDLDRAHRCLAACQEQVREIDQRVTADLMSFERLSQLQSLARRRGGEWPGWLKCLRAGLEDCRSPLRETNAALLHCWQEIAERVGMTSLSVQTIGLGQLVVAPQAGETSQQTVPGTAESRV